MYGLEGKLELSKVALEELLLVFLKTWLWVAPAEADHDTCTRSVNVPSLAETPVGGGGNGIGFIIRGR